MNCSPEQFKDLREEFAYMQSIVKGEEVKPEEIYLVHNPDENNIVASEYFLKNKNKDNYE